MVTYINLFFNPFLAIDNFGEIWEMDYKYNLVSLVNSAGLF